MARNDKAIREAVKRGDFAEAARLADEVTTRGGSVFASVRAMLTGKADAPGSYAAVIAYAAGTVGTSKAAAEKRDAVAKFAKADEDAGKAVSDVAALHGEIVAEIIATTDKATAERVAFAAYDFGGGAYYGANGAGAMLRSIIGGGTAAEFAATVKAAKEKADARKAAAAAAKAKATRGK